MEIQAICQCTAKSLFFFYTVFLFLRYLYPIIIFFLFRVQMLFPQALPQVLSFNLCNAFVALADVGRMPHLVTITLLTLNCLYLLQGHMVHLWELCLKFKFREIFSVLLGRGEEWACCRFFEIIWFENQASISGQAAIFSCYWVLFQGWAKANQHNCFLILNNSSPFTCLKGCSK